jgi:type VI secretion system secreted protein VgrG
MQVAAKKDLKLQTANAHIDWAAAKKITLATAGGASIVIEGGNITVQCPGKITVKAGKKSFVGGGGQSYALPKLPRSAIPARELKFNIVLTDVPGPNGHPLAFTDWKIALSSRPPEGLGLIDETQLVAEGQTDAKGRVVFTPEQEKLVAQAYCQAPSGVWLVHRGQAALLDVVTHRPDWSLQDRLLHALNAADFSPEQHYTRFDPGVRDELRYAREATRELGDVGLAKKLGNL